MTAHVDTKERTEALTMAGLAVAERDGWQRMTREAVAAEAGVSPALVTLRLGTVPAMRRAVMRRAVAMRVVPVVAAGLALGDKHAQKAGQELRDEIAAWVAKQ